MTTINKDELVKQSGENLIRQAPQLKLPRLTLHGRKGIYRETDIDGKETLLGEELKVVFLKIRKSYRFYKKNKQEETILFSTEGDDENSKIALFQLFTNKEGRRMANKIDEGTCKEIKSRHKELKFVQIVYCLLDDRVVKLNIKGSSLSNLFNYFQEFGQNEHIFEFWTILGREKLVDPQDIPYYPMTFTRGEPLKEDEMEKVAENIKEIADKLKQIEQWQIDRYGEDNLFKEEPADEEYAVSEEELLQPKPFKGRQIESDDIPIINEEGEKSFWKVH